jgi:hypothetical protein
MHAIRATSAFDGHRFLDGGVTVLVDDGRIAGVEGPHHDPPADAPSRRTTARCCPG